MADYDKDEDFFEDDELIEDVVAVFDRAEKGITWPAEGPTEMTALIRDDGLFLISPAPQVAESAHDSEAAEFTLVVRPGE